MQPLSLETWQQLRALYEPSSLMDQLLRRHPQRAEALERIGAAGELISVCYLLPLITTGRTTAAAAASVVRHLIENASTLDLVELDHEARGYGPYYADEIWKKWRQLRVADLPSLESTADGWAALGVSSLHPSGYVREAAVQLLSLSPEGGALPFLLLRLNDWVDPVRHAASLALANRLETAEPARLLDLLPLLLRMRDWSRRDHTPFVDSVLARLQQPEAAEALKRGQTSDDPLVRRECFRLSLTCGAVEPLPVLERALLDASPDIRLLGVGHSGLLDDEQLARYLATAIGDAAASVRFAALEAYASRLPQHAAQPLRVALLDTNSAVRWLARSQLQSLTGSFDSAEFYRDALSRQAGRRLRGAILGLAEAGEAADASLVQPYCTHPSVKVREAAIRSLARLDPRSHAPVLVDALADPSPRVCHQARRILSEAPSLIDTDTLRDYALDAIWPTHTRVSALRLLLHRSKWVSLPVYLAAANSPDPEIAQTARDFLGAWYGRDQLKPSPAQLEEIDEALRAAGPSLEAAIVERIQAEITQWRSRKP